MSSPIQIKWHLIIEWKLQACLFGQLQWHFGFDLRRQGLQPVGRAMRVEPGKLLRVAHASHAQAHWKMNAMHKESLAEKPHRTLAIAVTADRFWAALLAIGRLVQVQA